MKPEWSEQYLKHLALSRVDKSPAMGFFPAHEEGLVCHVDEVDKDVVLGWSLAVHTLGCHLHLRTSTCGYHRSGRIATRLVVLHIVKPLPVSWVACVKLVEQIHWRPTAVADLGIMVMPGCIT